MKRQDQHREAEIAATLDTARFIERAEEIYGYRNFVCDTSGSICEVVNPHDPDDPVMGQLARNLLLVWIKGSEAHTEELVRRFDRAPKPMYYQPAFLHAAWEEYRTLHDATEETCDPDHFVRWTYARRSPTASRAIRPWRRAGASPSPPKRWPRSARPPTSTA